MYKLIFVLVITIGLISCEKDMPEPEKNTIQGTWIWLKTYGGIGGWEYTPESEMYTRKLVIDETHYKEFVDDSLTLEVEYTLGIADESQIGTTDSTYIEFSTGGRMAYHLDENELELHQQAFDGFSFYYIREN